MASSAATSSARRDRGERIRAQRVQVAGQVGEVHTVLAGESETRRAIDRRGSRVSRWLPLSGALRGLDDPRKRGGVAHGDVGQDLAVELDLGLL